VFSPFLWFRTPLQVVLLCQQLLELLKPISMEVANGLYQNSQCTLSRKQQMKKVEEFNRGISLHLVFFKALLGGACSSNESNAA